MTALFPKFFLLPMSVYFKRWFIVYYNMIVYNRAIWKHIIYPYKKTDIYDMDERFLKYQYPFIPLVLRHCVEYDSHFLLFIRNRLGPGGWIATRISSLRVAMFIFHNMLELEKIIFKVFLRFRQWKDKQRRQALYLNLCDEGRLMRIKSYYVLMLVLLGIVVFTIIPRIQEVLHVETKGELRSALVTESNKVTHTANINNQLLDKITALEKSNRESLARVDALIKEKKRLSEELSKIQFETKQKIEYYKAHNQDELATLEKNKVIIDSIWDSWESTKLKGLDEKDIKAQKDVYNVYAHALFPTS